MLQRYRINNCSDIAEDGGGYCLSEDVAELENELEKSKWISVDERAPEQDQSVIAYGVYDGEINGLGTLMVGSGVYVSNRVVQMEADAYYANLINITHWQPLPEPPK